MKNIAIRTYKITVLTVNNSCQLTLRTIDASNYQSLYGPGVLGEEAQ